MKGQLVKDNTRTINSIKKKLHNTRDRRIRIKAELIMLGLRIGVKEACQRRGYSRVYWYKWWNRYKRSGCHLEALKERSRRPKYSPKRITERLEKRIGQMARKGYGSPTIQAHLKLDGIKLSQSTIGKVIRGRRKKTPKEKILKAHRRRYELLVPGQRVQMDVKYVPYPIDGRMAYNYVAVDECTRLRVIRTFTELNAHSTVLFLKELKEKMPFKIHCIQTDNGFEFTNRLNPKAVNWEHPMKTWCDENKIYHRMIPPGEKELNGKVERSHRIDEEFFYQRNQKRSFISFANALDQWLTFYNTKRLHGGLEFITPKQKLEERYDRLKEMCFLDPKLEQMRVEFLKSAPKKPKQREEKKELIEELDVLLQKFNCGR